MNIFEEIRQVIRRSRNAMTLTDEIEAILKNAEAHDFHGIDPHKQIALIWSVADVHDLANDASETDAPSVFTDEQARQILSDVLHHHDASQGVNWDTIAEAIRPPVVEARRFNRANEAP
jgi:hypothetical protein